MSSEHEDESRVETMTMTEKLDVSVSFGCWEVKQGLQRSTTLSIQRTQQWKLGGVGI